MRIAVIAGLMSVLWLLVLSGCSSEQTGAQQLASACKSQTDMPAEGCDCLSGLAESRLSEPAALWLATAMQGDTEKALQLKENVPWTELLEASLFMMNASQECALQFDEEQMPTLE